MAYYRLEDLLAEGSLHYIGSIQTIHTVDSEDSLLPTERAGRYVSVDPGRRGDREIYLARSFSSHTHTYTDTHTHTPAESKLLVEAASGIHKSLNGTILISFAGVTEEREREIII